MIKTKLETLLSLDRQCNLIKYSRLAAAKHPQAALAEFGCYNCGGLEILARTNPDRDIFGIDSFGPGLPEAGPDDFHSAGDFAGVDFLSLKGYFRLMHPRVKLVKGFSPKVFEFFDESSIFSFLSLDVDLYSSVKDGLEFFFPRMLKGGIMLIDDMSVRSTPGATKAILEFFEDKEVEFKGEIEYYPGNKHYQYLVVI